MEVLCGLAKWSNGWYKWRPGGAIPNRSRVKNLGTYSTFESFLNFKRGLNLLEKSGKFLTCSSQK
jgi:hypothetical protein